MDVYCTLYSHELCFDTLAEKVKEVFPGGALTKSEKEGFRHLNATVKGGVFKSKSLFQLSYRERNRPSFQITEIDSPLTQNLAGMSGFVSSLPAKNGKIKELLLKKIQTLNCEFSLLFSGNLETELKELAANIAKAVKAIVFCPPGRNISKSAGQHFLDENLDLVLDVQGNCDVDDLKVTINSVYIDGDRKNLKNDQKKRKTDSEKILKKNKIKINGNLPAVKSEEDVKIRSAGEIAERTVILAITNMVAFNTITNEQAKEYLGKHSLSEKLTPLEKNFLDNPTEEKKSQTTWKCECIWMLMWSLNIVDDPGFPDTMADLNNIPQEKYPVGADKDPNDFIKNAHTARPASEILDAVDLYFRMNWACVDARINGQEMTAVNPGIVYERHYALNWLINYRDQDWDNVSCDT